MVEYWYRQTRERRWERPDDDITYDANELDRRVVPKHQIRAILRTVTLEKLSSILAVVRREVEVALAHMGPARKGAGLARIEIGHLLEDPGPHRIDP